MRQGEALIVGHPWRRVPAGWNERQSGTCQARVVVVVVSEVCAARYGTGAVGEGRTRDQERIVGRSTASASVGVAKEEIATVAVDESTASGYESEGLNHD